jgi:uncharacterized iron-regulated membrane protein
MRKRLWQLHSWLGLLAGLGLLVIGLTGSLLVFHDELESLFNPSLVRVDPPGPTGAPAAERLPLDTLLAHAQRQLPEHEITGWLPQYDEPRLADLLYVIERDHNEWLVATLDPYTGRLLASPRLGTKTLTGWLLELHYTFFADHAGLLLAGLFAVMLCLLGLSGLWIYREFWKNFLTLRWGRGARILLSDLHKFVGITSVAFNLILGFTGAYWNLTHLIGHWINGDPPQPRIEQRLYAGTLSLDALARDAAQRLPGFRGNFISLPSDPAAPAVILWGTIEPRGRFTSPYGSTVSYDPKTGAHTATSDLRTQGWWARFVDTFAPLHYGTFGGLPVKILWCLGGLTPGLLGITGFLIWFRRRRATGRKTTPAPRAIEVVPA